MLIKSKALFAIFFCALALSCKSGSQEKELLEVRTIRAKKEKQSVCLETFGSVTYNKKNEVTALVDGTIFELNAREGSKVSKGQALLRMKNVQYEIQKTECQNELNSARAKIRAAQNNLLEQERALRSRIAGLENSMSNLEQKKQEHELCKKNLEKNRRLLEAGGISQSSFERLEVEEKAAATEIDILQKEIEAAKIGFRDSDLIAAGIVPSEDSEQKLLQLIDLNLQSAKIEIELAQVAAQNAQENLNSINSLIENLTIRAPASGIVGALNCENGESVTQNQALATIIDMEEPYAQVCVQERDMQKIALGSPVLAQIESLGAIQESHVAFISPLADLETGNFTLKIPLKNDGQKIRMGMFAQCSIQTQESGEFYELPQSAVVSRNGNKAAFFCVKNEYVYKKECPVEMEKNGKIFVANGLSDGEIVVERPTPAIKEGLHVKAI